MRSRLPAWECVLSVSLLLLPLEAPVAADPAEPQAAAVAEEDPVAAYRGKVEPAVDRGLEYLAKNQQADGSFANEYGKTTAVVSLSGMAFLAKGYTPGQGPYGEVLNRCVDYVLANQVPYQKMEGYFGGVADGKMYSHNIATLFLCEISGMVDPVRQKKVDGALAKATRLILSAQQIQKGDPNKGGWRYAPDSSDSDLSCSGWALMALRSAKLNGAPVPDQAIEDAVAYILKCRDPNSGGFGYTGPSGAITLTGAALLCLELTGHHGDPVTVKAGDFILSQYQQLAAQSQAAYGVYYSAQGTFQLGGKYWQKYAKWMYECYLPKQQPDGSWNHANGPTYNTAMMVLAFTVPYRQLPIYQRDETVDER